jgi:hypothetical protein
MKNKTGILERLKTETSALKRTALWLESRTYTGATAGTRRKWDRAVGRALGIALLLLVFAFPAFAQPDPIFRSHEFSVRLAVMNPMDMNAPATFDPQAKSLAGFEAGMGYYFTRYVGAEVNVPVWRSDDRCFQSVSAGMMARLPMDTFLHGSIWEHVAPYARAGLGYSECWTSPYSIYVGGGVEVRVNKRLGVFGGVVYSRRGAFESDSWGVWRPEVGMRLAF